MTNQHPITPPPGLTDKWNNLPLSTEEIFVIAARWGADQELEACIEWLDERAVLNGSTALRAARRPKPPTLKEQALKTVDEMSDCMSAGFIPKRSDLDAIRFVLEALPND
jgi:hypothetical protein